MVRPWKAPSIAMMRVRPVRRVALKAASLASVPELQKKTFAPRSGWFTVAKPASRSARAICAGVAKKFETWLRVDSWLVIAESTAGCACPRALTAIPLRRSR